jgi:SAM-dependent methyltransferase
MPPEMIESMKPDPLHAPSALLACFAEEQKWVTRLLPWLAGRVWVQVGMMPALSTHVTLSVLSSEALPALSPTASTVFADPCALPLANQSVDVLILPHTLEHSPDPHALLREACRVLNDRGRLLIFGFHPWWGFKQHWTHPRPHGLYLRSRVSDWLAVLALQVEKRESFKLDSRTWLPAEGYVLLARKRIYPLTPRRTKAVVPAFKPVTAAFKTFFDAFL